MRVAVHVEGSEVRGSERQVALLVRGLVARGHGIAVSVPPATPSSELFTAAGADLTRARPRGDLALLSWGRFVGWLRGSRPDVLLATSWKRAAAVLAAGRAARVPRTVLRVGGPHTDRGRLGDRARAHAFAHWLDAAYTNSAALREQLLAYAPALPPDRVVVIPNAVAPMRAAPAPVRADLGLEPGAPLVLSVGGLERNKGFDVLIRALASSSRRNAHLAVAGAGREQAELERLAVGLGVGARVHFLGARADVPALLRAAGAFALASREDSTPNAVLEAMDAELPVVMTATLGAEQLLGTRPERPRAGWVVPVEDAEALARALDEALGPDGAPRAREAARRVREEHDAERTVARIEALLTGSE